MDFFSFFAQSSSCALTNIHIWISPYILIQAHTNGEEVEAFKKVKENDLNWMTILFVADQMKKRNRLFCIIQIKFFILFYCYQEIIVAVYWLIFLSIISSSSPLHFVPSILICGLCGDSNFKWKEKEIFMMLFISYCTKICTSYDFILFLPFFDKLSADEADDEKRKIIKWESFKKF